MRVVEDAPYGELRHAGALLPARAAQPAAAQHVLHLGSFSEIRAPGVRLGWARSPRGLRTAVAVVEQAADLDAHVAGVVAECSTRRDAVPAALEAELPVGSTWSRPDRGMSTRVRLPGDVDTAGLLPAALRHGVAFVPGEAFSAGGPDRATLRLSFTTHSPDRTVEGISRLGPALRT